MRSIFQQGIVLSTMADFGEILQEIGEFGIFQQVVLFALALPLAWEQFSFIYLVEPDPERHCNTDWILAAEPSLSREEKLNLTVPRQEDGTFSRCLMFVPVDWNISAIRERGLNRTTGCRDGWVYSSALYRATIVTDFDLVCDQAHLFQIVQTVGRMGGAVGSVISGPLAESFGRKQVTQISFVLTLTFSATSAFCNNIYFFIICQLFMAVGVEGLDLNANVLATEWIGTTRRSWAAVFTRLFITAGHAMCMGLVYATRDWRRTQLIVAALCAVSSLYMWFIPESARWLLHRGRTDEAKQLISKVAKINKRSPPQFLQKPTVETTPQRRTSIVALFKSTVLRRFFLVVTIAWCSQRLSHSSISLNVANFGTDVFVTMLLFYLTELPTHILSVWFLEVLGRKVSLILALLTGGVFLATLALVPQSATLTVTLLATVARLLTILAGSVTALYIQELFPTTMRLTACGLSTSISKTSTILVPFLSTFVVNDIFIPPLMCGCLLVVSSALCFLLPETRRRELPESVSEAVDDRHERTDAGKDTCEESQTSRL